MKHALVVVSFFLSLLWISGCSNKNDSSLSQSFAAFENSPPRAVAELISAFGIESNNQAGAVIAFYTNQRYFSGVVQKLSDVHYRIAATVGVYSESGGLNFRAYRTTCRSLFEKYKGMAKVAGSVNGNYLTITMGATTTVLARIHTPPPAAPKNGFVIEWGCFNEQTGAFTPEGWSNL